MTGASCFGRTPDAIALAGWGVREIAAKRDAWQLMGELRIPNRCVVEVDASGIDRADVRVDYFRSEDGGAERRTPRRIFDGRSCASFAGSEEEHVLVIRTGTDDPCTSSDQRSRARPSNGTPAGRTR